MAESLFHQARENGSLGIIFSVSAAAPETIASMTLTNAERAVLDDATACAAYLRDHGVPKSLMEGSDKRVAVCRRILEVKKQSKLKSLMRKFLDRMATNDGGQGHNLGTKTHLCPRAGRGRGIPVGRSLGRVGHGIIDRVGHLGLFGPSVEKIIAAVGKQSIA